MFEFIHASVKMTAVTLKDLNVIHKAASLFFDAAAVYEENNKTVLSTFCPWICQFFMIVFL